MLKSILVAEDNAKDLELTLTALDEYNLANEVAVVRDGEEALEYLYRTGKYADRPKGNPVVLLLDIKMPKVDGLEVLRKMKSDPELKPIPVVVLTSSREESDLVEGYRLGVNAFVVKPVDFTRFMDAVKQLGQFWALLNEPPVGSKRAGMTLNLRVLILEDSAADAELTLATLEQEGVACESVRVETGPAFTNALRSAPPFDLILSDCSLPSFDGQSALKIAREIAPHIPLIFVSGTMGEEVAIESLKNGATDYVLKHRLSRLGPAVRRAIAESKERTARQEAEDARSRAESLVHAVFEQMTIGVAITDVTGRIRRTNGALHEMMGYNEQELAALSMDQLAGSLETGGRACYADLLSDVQLSCEFECQYKRRDGTTLWSQTVVSAIRAGGRVAFFVHLIKDITSRKEMEQRFLETQKMEVVGRLAAGIAHDFNSLLTVINGYSDLLLSRLPAGTEMRRELDEIRCACERAGHLTQRLLSFGRRSVTQCAAVELNQVVVGLKDMLRRVCGEEITLITKLDPDAGPVQCNQTQIEQAILNLIINARDAMPAGGELTIATGCVELREETAKTHRLPAGPYVTLTVIDTGCGMSEVTRASIFQPFFTTKAVGKGTGLGLWMVQETIRQSGGAIAVTSEVGRGTSFELLLPWTANQAVIEPQASEFLVRPGAGGETVLVADDEDAVRELLCETLEGAGYRVLQASSGVEAVAISGSEPGEIHLLLTDYSMPGMRGSELAAQVTALRPRTAVICISGGADRAAFTDGSSGKWKFLPKPFGCDALLDAVRQSITGPAAPGPAAPGPGPQA